MWLLSKINNSYVKRNRNINKKFPFRYATENWQMTGTVGVSGLHLCYYQKASKQLQVGVELEANSRMQEAVASIGYQVDIPKSDVVFKGK